MELCSSGADQLPQPQRRKQNKNHTISFYRIRNTFSYWISFRIFFAFITSCVAVLGRALQLSGSNGKEYHFMHRVLQHARTRRSIPHTRVLKREPLVCIKFYIFAPYRFFFCYFVCELFPISSAHEGTADDITVCSAISESLCFHLFFKICRRGRFKQCNCWLRPGHNIGNIELSILM